MFGKVMAIVAIIAAALVMQGACIKVMFDPDGWRACTQNNGEFMSYAHSDDKGVNDFDFSCMMKYHMSYFGTDYIPKGPSFGRDFSPVPLSSLDDEVNDAITQATEDGCRQRRGNGMPFGFQGQLRKKIQEVNGCVPSREFLNHFARLQRPVVMRSCFTGSGLEKWATDDYLRDVAVLNDGPSDGSLDEIVDDHRQKFQKYLNYYRQSALDTFVGVSEYKSFVIEDLNTKPPAQTMMADLNYPSFFAGDISAILGLQRVMLWLSAGGVNSQLHNDPHDAVLAQVVAGPKEVLLVDPLESHKIYHDFPVEEHGTKFDVGKMGYSPIKPNKVDLCKYPRVSEAGVYNVSIHPGDALYIPGNWWHLVNSKPEKPTKTSRNVALTIQGQFLWGSVPKPPSAASLYLSHSDLRGCTMDKYHYVVPPEDPEVCNPDKNKFPNASIEFEHIIGPILPTFDCVRKPLRYAQRGPTSELRLLEGIFDESYHDPGMKVDVRPSSGDGDPQAENNYYMYQIQRRAVEMKMAMETSAIQDAADKVEDDRYLEEMCDKANHESRSYSNECTSDTVEETLPWGLAENAHEFVHRAFEVQSNRSICSTWLNLDNYFTRWIFKDGYHLQFGDICSERKPSDAVIVSKHTLDGFVSTPDVIVEARVDFQTILAILEMYFRSKDPRDNVSDQWHYGPPMPELSRVVKSPKNLPHNAAMVQLANAMFGFWGEIVDIDLLNLGERVLLKTRCKFKMKKAREEGGR